MWRSTGFGSQTPTLAMPAAAQLSRVNYALIFCPYKRKVLLLLSEGSTLALGSTVGSEET